MSYLHQDLPSPGRFSLGRVFAARLGHARRKARAFVPQGCDQQGRHEPTIRPAEACSEYLEDGEPVTGIEALKFWATVCAPAFVGVIGYAVLIWALQP